MKYNLLFIGLCLLLLAACKKDEPKSSLDITGLTPESGSKNTMVTITGKGFRARFKISCNHFRD